MIFFAICVLGFALGYMSGRTYAIKIAFDETARILQNIIDRMKS